jgi:hypothetical protein
MKGYLISRKDDISRVLSKDVLVNEDQISRYMELYVDNTYGKKINDITVDLKSRSVRFMIDQYNNNSYDVPAKYWLIKVEIAI